MKHFIFRQR